MNKQKTPKFLSLCTKYGVNAENVPEILTYEEACKITKRDPKVKRDLMQKTIITIEAFCKELKWKADYDNVNQDRWIAVHEKTSAGLVFTLTIYEIWRSGSVACVGAPFVLPNDDCASFMGQHFLPLYGWKLNYKVK